ncbi:MAG: HEPN domain-containing protein [Oscillospiraceae bacterium]|jgi:HEPN domain-containing protein|nr:HEPN domain-containing protein [Oscillospiraceae bacterium]
MMNKSAYWLDLAEYDLSAAAVMLNGKRFIYVGFMCHQTIEKALKAVIARDCKEDESPPKTHDLSKLAIAAGLIDVMSEEQIKFLEYLNPLNIEARYPEFRQRLLSVLSVERCRRIMAETEDLLCWIKNRL